MDVVYAGQKLPGTITRSIFLAGPTPRGPEAESWRPAALQYLREEGYEGVVFVPISINPPLIGGENCQDSRKGAWGQDGQWTQGYTAQVEWEERCLNMADCIVFWVPRDMETMPALTTNVEWGVWCNSGKVVLGFPPDAPKMRYLKHYAREYSVPMGATLENTLDAALELIGPGIGPGAPPERMKGERFVPMYIWKTPAFQAWYMAQLHAGNTLEDAKVVWTFRVGPGGKIVFFWALHVDVFITSEKRHKTNEVVLARPDISTIAVFYLKKEGPVESRDLLDTEIALVREFRSPASTSDGFIWEIPGGSSWKETEDPAETAVHELEEETGLKVEPSRMEYLGARQVAGTLSAHKAHCFACQLSADEMDQLRGEAGVVHGVVGDSERTYVEIRTLRSILDSGLVDWANLGMLFQALVGR